MTILCRNIIVVFILVSSFTCSNRIESPLNIIVLLADDLRYDALSCTGNDYIKTPNIDGLASKGCLFTNAFVTTSICSVSRASILTGQYARRHGIFGFDKSLTDEQLSESYPILLKNSGYAIGFVGKYGLGGKLPSDDFDYWKGYSGQGVYQATDVNEQPIHLTKLMANEASKFIEKYGDGEKPFCLSVSFKAPHVQEDQNSQTPTFPFDTEYANILSDAQINRPTSYVDTGFPDLFI
ncbi:MAG: sulfatase-like hydrolase/transferase, partial [Bacteroidales bacterium]